jgi:hypothetical protein
MISLNITVFWDAVTFSPVPHYQCFRETCYLYFQGSSSLMMEAEENIPPKHWKQATDSIAITTPNLTQVIKPLVRMVDSSHHSYVDSFIHCLTHT